MIIEFDEKDHVYSVNGEIARVSVTQLLRKHGLAPNYDGVNKQNLEYAAKQGTAVHKDLEDLVNAKNFLEYQPTTRQGEQFKNWAKEHLNGAIAEQVLGLDYKSMYIAGTADLMAIMQDGSLMLADHKNTSVFHREYVTWQVSLLDYMARKLDGTILNGKNFTWKGATKFYCFHFNPKSKMMRVYPLTKIDDSEIERLLESEFNGEIYQRPMLCIDEKLQKQVLMAEKRLIKIEQQNKKAKEQCEKLRGKLLELFKEQKIHTWESPDKAIQITYVPQTDRISVDSAKLKTDFPMVYDKCTKISTVKEQLKVKIRENDDAI